MNRNKAMNQAIRLAEQGHGIVFDRPFSSFLVMDDDKIGFSWYDGSPMSLKEAFEFENQPLKGTLYLPYEPELTSYLQDWILEHPITQICIGAPNADSPYRFTNWAKSQEITVEIAVEIAKANRLNEVFFHNLRTGLPFVTLSFGMSLDGKIATKTGDSKYISGSSSRMFVHRLRHRHQAILVGINTILIDHPHLTTRLVGKQGKDAHRIILDSSLKISPDEPVITQSSTAKTIVVTRKDSDPDKKARLIEKGVSLIEIEDPSHPLNLHEMLKKVKVLGIDSILVEGGSTVHFSFIEAHLFQRLFASISPLIIGGDTAKSAVGGAGFSWLRDAMKLKFVKLHHAGNDIIIEAIPQTLDSSHASSILPRGDKP